MCEQVLDRDPGRILLGEIEREAILERCGQGELSLRNEFTDRQSGQELRPGGNPEAGLACIRDPVAPVGIACCAFKQNPAVLTNGHDT